jgi:hypothetical protein
MITLEYEMTYRETIEGPLPSTKGAPLGERLCWKISAATLSGPRISASLAMPGMDWMRLTSDGLRRQDLRVPLLTDNGTTILFHYDTGMIRATSAFLEALLNGGTTDWADQYMRVVPEFDVGEDSYAWLNQSLFIAEGRVSGPKEIEYAIYRVE